MLGVLDDDSEGSRVHNFIGIIVAISGNIVISLALNCQKLAHKRLEAEAAQQLSRRPPSPVNTPSSKVTPRSDAQRPRDTTLLRPLRSPIAKYSSVVSSRFKGSGYDTSNRYTAIPSDDNEGSDIPQSSNAIADSISADANHFTIEEESGAAEVFSANNSPQSGEFPPPKMESNYLKSKLWWLGFTLMNIGEIGNFLSYGFAPASLVAPLGSFALIANCIFAPLMLGEQFRKLDLLGLTLCIVGIVTIVLSSKPSHMRLDPDALIAAISRTFFVVYSIMNVVLACILAPLSNRKIGQEKVWIDLGLCALFGGYTVLCTKGLSTLLSLAWIQIFRFWITYPLAAILLITGVGQIRYLNRALMKFDSKVVIPTQFVLFNFTAIVGSAVLYRDFDKLPFERFVIFIYGCAATFLGVFTLARTNPSAVNDDEASTVRGGPDTQSESGTSTTAHQASIHHGSPSTHSPAQNHPNLLFPGSTPPIAGSSAGSVRATIRPRASSSTIGLSPAKYLLLATEPISPGSVPLPMPILRVPLARQQSTPTPQRRGSNQAAGSRIIPSRIASRSPSRDRGAESAGISGGHNSRTGT